VCLEKHATLWLHNTGRLQYDDNGKKLMFVAFVRDITEDRKVRKELLVAQEASVAKSDFLAKMSHEIKTPLNAIIGMSDALSQEDLPEDVLETITFITNAAEGLNGLLSQTLDHAKLLSGNVSALPEETSIHSLVNNTCGMWKISCKNKNLSLTHTVDIPDRIMLDQHRFQQCLNNLLSNAIKFTPKGEIAVGVTARETRNGKQVLLISVKDTGIGMNDHALRNIFEPFKQADDSITRRFGGTGLGMAITKQLVGVLGGKISARSTEGKGTTFLMALPLVTVDTAQAPSAPPMQSRAPIPVPSIIPETEIIPTFAPSTTVQETISDSVPDLDIPKQRLSLDQEHAGRLSGLRILVVEDNPINQAVVKKLISKEVESLTFANNGVQALDALRTQNFDLILMDIHMPVKDGIETTIEIRSSDQAWANVIIIALTADPDYQQQRICRNIGMNDAIAKPVKRQDIINAIERTLENESYHAAPRHSDQMTG
jgi:signal transduction histidine kinase/ActR/RegA family two-component response regulator